MEIVKVKSGCSAGGNVEGLQPGEATIQGTIPGLPQIKDFCLLTVWESRRFDEDGAIHWDIVAMVVGFGISTTCNRFSGQGSLVATHNSRL